MATTNGQLWTQQFTKPNGCPYAGVRVFHYVAGGTTDNLEVFLDGAMTTAAANPVVGDDAGRVSFYGSGTYRLFIKSSIADGDLVLYDWDPVEIVHHTTTMRAEERGIALPSASVAARGRLFGMVNGGGDVLSLWLQRTATAWSQLTMLPDLDQMLAFAKGSDIASSANVTIPSNGNFFDLTGVNTVETLSGFTGYPVIYLRTPSILTFKHSANLVMAGGLNRASKAGQVTAFLYAGASVWVELFHSQFPGYAYFDSDSLTDGAVLIGNGVNSVTQLALPAATRSLLHRGGAGQDPLWGAGLSYQGPTSMVSGSTVGHSGTVVLATNASLGGVQYFTSLTLNAGVTVTVPVNSRALVIIASDFIVINGSINASGAGAAGGGGGRNVNTVVLASPGVGGNGTDQAAGNGGSAGNFGGASGGDAVIHGVTVATSAQLTGASLLGLIHSPWLATGAAGGGGGGADDPNGSNGTGGVGGRGGGSIVLIAPSITIGSGSILNTSGLSGATATGTLSGGGGGGGGGNIYMICSTFTDNGATYTQNGGSGGGGAAGGNAGGSGLAGVRQIIRY